MSLLCHIHGEIGFYTMLNSDSIFKSSDNSKFSLIPDKKWEQGKKWKSISFSEPHFNHEFESSKPSNF